MVAHSTGGRKVAGSNPVAPIFLFLSGPAGLGPVRSSPPTGTRQPSSGPSQQGSRGKRRAHRPDLLLRGRGGLRGLLPPPGRRNCGKPGSASRPGPPVGLRDPPAPRGQSGRRRQFRSAGSVQAAPADSRRDRPGVEGSGADQCNTVPVTPTATARCLRRRVSLMPLPCSRREPGENIPTAAPLEDQLQHVLQTQDGHRDDSADHHHRCRDHRGGWTDESW